MRCALYFGSFNPLHIGHAAIARYVLQNCNIDSLRLVLTPMNPFKSNDVSLTDVQQRLADLKESVKKFNEELGCCSRLEISTVEFNLPKPNYTYNTLEFLKKSEPENTFVIIMGADNLAAIEKWYKGLDILKEYEVWVYPRKGFDTRMLCNKYGATFLDATLVDVSSTMIREGEREGMDMSELRY